MSIADLASIASSVPLGPVANILSQTYTTIQNVRVHRQRCMDLNERCIALLLNLRDNADKDMAGTRVAEWLDELAANVEKINRKVQEWSQYSALKSFLQQTDIREGIDKLNRDIDTSCVRFSINIGTHLAQNSRDLLAIQERDHAELRETLYNIVQNTQAIQNLVGMRSPEAVEEVMQGLQEELQHSSLEPSDKQILRSGLWELHSRTKMLPPMADLTGQVVRSSDIPAAFGAHNDVYRGVWLDKEAVALRLPRMLVQTITVQKHFQREVAVWRSLEPHPNVVPLYGIARIDGRVYSVSPWMDGGNAVEYLRSHNGMNRLQILIEVATGLGHLHANRIVHGDLRGFNVLVSKDGVARLSDFGLSKFLEDLNQGMTSNSGTNLRWSAPELLQPSGAISTCSDVWSFGMVCLELMTCSQPYSDFTRDPTVMREIDMGRLPSRPEPREAYASIGLTDELWHILTQMCWQYQPNKRASVPDIKARISRHKRRETICSVRDLPPTSPKIVVQGPPTVESDRYSHIPKGNPHHWTGVVRQESIAESVGKLSNASGSFNDKWYKPSATSASPPQIELDLVPSPSAFEPSPPPSALFAGLSVTSPTSLAPVITRSKSGSVMRGDKAGLFGLLIEPSSCNLQRGVDYRQMLLTIHSLFCGTHEILEFLISNFNSDSNITPEQRASLRFNILVVLESWLSASSYRPDDNSIMAIQRFLMAISENEFSPTTLRQRAVRILDVADRALQLNYLNHTLLAMSPGRRVPAASEVSPHDLAVALTLFEGHLFGLISASEYIAHFQDASLTDSSVVRLTRTGDKIAMFVKRTILRSSQVESRAGHFKFLVNTAEECFKLKNYSSMSIILTALGSPEINALERTLAAVSARTRRLFGDLSQHISPVNNHNAYKSLLPQPSASSATCVPWIAVHLRDLSWAYRLRPFEITFDNQTLVEFTACADFYDQLQIVLRFSPPDLRRHRDDEAFAYLQDQLKDIRTDQRAHDQVTQRSAELAAKESRDYATRRREIRDAGFG